METDDKISLNGSGNGSVNMVKIGTKYVVPNKT